MQLDLFLKEDAIVLAPTEDNPDIYMLEQYGRSEEFVKKSYLYILGY